MNTGQVVTPAYPGVYPIMPEDSVWTRRGTWGSIVVGALVGFAITVIMFTFGAAAGISAGAAAAHNEGESYGGNRVERSSVDRAVVPPDRPAERSNDRSPTERADRGRPAEQRGGVVAPEQVPAESAAIANPAKADDERKAMKTAAVGGSMWLILTAIVVGLVGGGVVGRIAQVYTRDITIMGAATWAVGVLILMSLAAFGASGMLGGLGAGAGQLAATAPPDVDPETAKAAASAATIAAWGFFVSLVVGLLATITGAKAGMKRRLRRYATPTTPTDRVALDPVTH